MKLFASLCVILVLNTLRIEGTFQILRYHRRLNNFVSDLGRYLYHDYVSNHHHSHSHYHNHQAPCGLHPLYHPDHHHHYPHYSSYYPYKTWPYHHHHLSDYDYHHY